MKHYWIMLLVISQSAYAQQPPSPDRETLIIKCEEGFRKGRAFKHLRAAGASDQAIIDRCAQEADTYFPQTGTK
jgi:hypothetical protein